MFNLQTVICVDGVEYPIDTDFKKWISFQEIFKVKDTEDKIKKIVSFMAALGVPICESALNEVLNFFAGNRGGSDSPSNTNKNLYYDFEQDYKYIYSAFLEQYGIDLLDDNVKLHWHKFKALFVSLSSECMFSKIIHYRSVNLNDVPKEQKNFYKKMKRLFSLKSTTPKMTTEEYYQYLLNKYKWG